MDEYKCFAELQAEQRENHDFRVRTVLRKGAKAAVIAPHGGAIEPGTSQIASEIAGNELSLALFEGIKPCGNRVLHITSVCFDEPRCVSVIEQSETAVAIHGEISDEAAVFIGGVNKRLCAHIGRALIEAGFCVREHKNPGLHGKSIENICNRGKSGGGVQIELSRGLRSVFF